MGSVHGSIDRSGTSCRGEMIAGVCPAFRHEAVQVRLLFAIPRLPAGPPILLHVALRIIVPAG